MNNNGGSLARAHKSAFALIASSLLLASCIHDLVKVIEKNESGGVISYTQPTWINGDVDASTLPTQFKAAAKEICGSRSWTVVKEVIPMPEASSALRNAASLDVKGALNSGANNVERDNQNRSNILNKDAPVEYGMPFQTGNQAHVKCGNAKNK